MITRYDSTLEVSETGAWVRWKDVEEMHKMLVSIQRENSIRGFLQPKHALHLEVVIQDTKPCNHAGRKVLAETGAAYCASCGTEVQQ